MRILNEKDEEIQESDCDLTLGALIPSQALKTDVAPIDNVTKFAWDDDDFEDVLLYMPLYTEDEVRQQKIDTLKSKLAATDYVVIKIAEGVATTEDYADVIADREAWRKEINELEGEDGV